MTTMSSCAIVAKVFKKGLILGLTEKKAKK